MKTPLPTASFRLRVHPSASIVCRIFSWYPLLGLFSTANLAQDYWDPNFGNPGVPADPGGVGGMVWLNDKLVIAGSFSQVGAIQATNVAIWDGKNWSPLGDGLGVREGNSFSSSFATVTVIQGELFAAGFFSNSGTTPVTNVAKWTGSNWMALGEGKGNFDRLQSNALRSSVSGIAGRSGNDLYVIGNFTSAVGVPARGIAHWNGNAWEPLGAGVSNSNGNAHVSAVLVTEDAVYIGGSFDTAGGVQAINVAKWNGSAWEALGGGLGISVHAVYGLALNGDSLYAVGSFQTALGRSPGIARWDGQNWTEIGTVERGASPYVTAVIPFANGIIAGGTFEGVGGVAATNIAQWTGREWAPLGAGLHSEGNAVVGVLVTHGSEIFAGGIFALAGGTPSTNIARWHIPQTLKVQSSINQVRLSWPAPDTNFVLEATSSLTNPNWLPVLQEPTLQDYRWTVTNVINGTNQFFRLRSRE